jgi:hypothetical protein
LQAIEDPARIARAVFAPVADDDACHVK